MKQRYFRLALIIVFIIVMTVGVLPQKAYAASKKPGKVNSLKATKGGAKDRRAIHLKWKKVKDATGYEIYCKTDFTDGKTDGKYEYLAYVKKGSTTKYTYPNGQLKGIHYSFKVRAIKDTKKKWYVGKFSKSVSVYLPEINLPFLLVSDESTKKSIWVESFGSYGANYKKANIKVVEDCSVKKSKQKSKMYRIDCIRKYNADTQQYETIELGPEVSYIYQAAGESVYFRLVPMDTSISKLKISKSMIEFPVSIDGKTYTNVVVGGNGGYVK